MKILAIDYGRKRIGVAVGSIIPKPLSLIDGTDLKKAIAKIAEICQEYEVEKIIIGLPIRSQGEEGTIVPEIKELAKQLEVEISLPVEFEEEQFTSTEAQDYVERHGIKNGKDILDSIAAAILLEQFLKSKTE